MSAKFHRRVQQDLDEILARYEEISPKLADDFFSELQASLERAMANPRWFHHDACGLRRCNLNRFPYHFLYDIREECIRVWVLRHDRRQTGFGLRRFDR